MNKDFNFPFSVSVGRYDRNNDSAKNLEWIEINADLNTLAEYVQNGIAFCNCFHHDSITFTNKLKTDNNIKSANMIIFDFDAVRLSFDEFVELMNKTEIHHHLFIPHRTTENSRQTKTKHIATDTE